MRRCKKIGRFKVKEVTVTERGFTYTTFRLTGWDQHGQRVRRQFKSRAEALGEKQILEVAAANCGEIHARLTRLTVAQLAEAEAAFARLNGKSLPVAVEWFLETYRPAVAQKALGEAAAAFMTDRKQHVGALTLRDYELTLAEFAKFAGAATAVHEIDTQRALDFLVSRGVGKKRWNNLRGDLHAFFEWCRRAPRQWTRENPIACIETFKVTRGVPQIETAAHMAEFFKFLEGYTGEYGRSQPAGFLVPYFSLATFAGLRPSVAEGEIFKLGGLAEPEKTVDMEVGVIRIGPEIAKTKDMRTVTIQPNLRQWLIRYPLRDYPILAPNLKLHVTRVRERWGLKGKDDVLRHTAISMHVAKFKSIGLAALEFGNSERVIKKHYLQRVSDAEAELFWSITPTHAAV